jgi:hypothetical protein
VRRASDTTRGDRLLVVVLPLELELECRDCCDQEQKFVVSGEVLQWTSWIRTERVLPAREMSVVCMKPSGKQAAS